MGFGICAFTYYRRIVERHKTELFDKFIEIAEDEHVPTERAGRPKATFRSQSCGREMFADRISRETS